MNKRLFGFLTLLIAVIPAFAQRMLNLDSCRALAIRNNKQLSISTLKTEVTKNARKSAHTMYLPHVDAGATYEYMSREISILSDDQKSTLQNMGTTVQTGLSTDLTPAITQMVQAGLLSQQTAQSLSSGLGKLGQSMATSLNSVGQRIVDDFHTDTHNFWAGSVIVTQPIFMGGKITALNNMAKYADEFANNSRDVMLQTTVNDIDNAYWSVVSLRHKKNLVESYIKTVKHLDSDISKMIAEGVATRSDGLSVSVRVNEAEMMLQQVDDGLVLSKMYLCQLCGIPMQEQITLMDENKDSLQVDVATSTADVETAMNNRPELKMLDNTKSITEQGVKLARSEYMPSLAFLGGYTVSNPNMFNSFQRKFSGMWHVGLVLKVPVWHWNDQMYKIRATKAQAAIAGMELSDAREKIELQVNQSSFKVNEAAKRYFMATKNTEHANENLRCATLGFKEGVIPIVNVLEAQTAWFQAQSQKIDAEVGIKLADVALKKALGTLY
jgi:outer membrane protein TolC